MEDKIETILTLAEKLTLSQLYYVTARLQAWCDCNKESMVWRFGRKNVFGTCKLLVIAANVVAFTKAWTKNCM